MTRRAVPLVMILALCWSFGCSSGPKPTNAIPVYPVTGKVLIDGEPVQGVMIYFYPVDKAEDVQVSPMEKASQHYATTDKDGVFKATTYVTGDGLPEGELVAAFYWIGKNPPPDKPFGIEQDAPQIDPAARPFNAKYGNPSVNKTQGNFKVTVAKGKPTDVGTWELISKK